MNGWISGNQALSWVNQVVFHEGVLQTRLSLIPYAKHGAGI